MRALLEDPRSRLQAVIAGWQNPVSREAIVLYDLFDLLFRANVSKASDFKPYPRPWVSRPHRSRLTASAAKAILKK